MNILLTGGSGFLGSRILNELAPGHTLITLGRQTISPRHVGCDLAKHVPDLANRPIDWVIHAAGKARSAPGSSRERADYEQVNVGGTTRLLMALERLPTLPRAIVYTSTVLVYGRWEGEWLTEQTPLEATDPYGLSKARSETLLQTWCKQTGVQLTILRLPLVVAHPPAGNLAALFTAIRRGYYVRVGAGLARRSMVRADDVAAVIGRAAGQTGVFHLTDGYHPYVHELEDAMAQQVGRTHLPTLPMAWARAIATTGDGINVLIGRRFPLDTIALRKVTSSLTFSDEAARQHLHWNPRPVLDCFRCA